MRAHGRRRGHHGTHRTTRATTSRRGRFSGEGIAPRTLTWEELLAQLHAQFLPGWTVASATMERLAVAWALKPRPHRASRPLAPWTSEPSRKRSRAYGLTVARKNCCVKPAGSWTLRLPWRSIVWRLLAYLLGTVDGLLRRAKCIPRSAWTRLLAGALEQHPERALPGALSQTQTHLRREFPWDDARGRALDDCPHAETQRRGWECRATNLCRSEERENRARARAGSQTH